MILKSNVSQALEPGIQGKLSVFNCARLCLMSLVLFTTIFLKQEVLGEYAIVQIYAALAASFLISLVNVSFWEQTLRIRWYMPSQLLYDLLLTSFLVYLTGVNESIFLFLYLINIVLAAVVYQLNGSLLVAALSGTVYGLIYFANNDTDSTAAIYSLAYNELLFLLTALLCGQFMDELRKQRALLDEQRESIARLEVYNIRLLNSIPVGIVTVDQNEYVKSINETALSLLGLRRTPDLLIKYYELLPDLRGIFEGWEQMTETQRIRFLFRYGEPRHPRFSLQLVSMRPGSNLDKPHHILVFEDVSKLIELEQKLEFESRLAATGELAAGIAHEIRNPLASISGSIEMLAENIKLPDPNDRKLMDISLREIRRLNNLVTDFLEFAKPRDNTSGNFVLHHLVDEVCEALSQRGPVTFSTDIPEMIAVHANRERIKQVLFNLFLNSIEASPGGVRITIKAASVHGGMIGINVSDTGPGIPENLMGKIFDPFFTTKSSGTGLGLSTVAQILKAAKGEIQALPGDKGAHFFLTIPASSSMELAGTGS